MTSIIIKSYVKERESEILKKLRDGMNKAVLIVENQAKKNIKEHSARTPWKKTGQLASNVISIVRDENNVIIGEIGIREGTKEKEGTTTLAKIGKYLELGHTQKPGRYVAAIGKRLKVEMVPPYPWLFPALESKKEEIKDALKGSRVEISQP